MKTTIGGMERARMDSYLNRKRLLLALKNVQDKSNEDKASYKNAVNGTDKWKSYLVGGTLFE